MSTTYENIWAEFSIPLRRYIKKRVHNEYDIDDILQTVFVKIISNLHCLKDANKIHSWVYSITRNTIIDYYKSQRNEYNIEDFMDEMTIEIQSEVSLNKEIAQCIETMLQYLPNKYREAIILTEFRNLTQKEFAILMGLSIPGAKSRVQRARRYIKNMLCDCCTIERDHIGNIIDYKRKNKTCDYC